MNFPRAKNLNLSKMGDAAKQRLRDTILIVMTLSQLATIVWGASSISHSVDELKIAYKEMRDDIRADRMSIGLLQVDVGILKAVRIK